VLLFRQKEEYMKTLAFATAISMLLTGASFAQSTNGTSAPTGGTPGTVQPSTMGNNSGKAAASGDNNQAVATTSANASTPAKGSNSFTMGEARRRIEKDGFMNVSGLAKDHDGIWRGTAQKDGKSASVWLDYKGNVGATN
jgi:hypothetical protein